MRKSFVLVACSGLAMGGALLACVGDDNAQPLPAVTDSGAKDSTTPPFDSATPADSGTDTATPVDAGTDAGDLDATLSCATIDVSAAPIIGATTIIGAPPTMTGGSIVPGDYAWISATAYYPEAGTSASIPLSRRVYRLTGSTAVVDTQEFPDDASADAAPTGEFVVGSDYTLDASTMTYDFVCGVDGGGGTQTFTTDGGTLVFSFPIGVANGTFVATYTRK